MTDTLKASIAKLTGKTAGDLKPRAVAKSVLWGLTCGDGKHQPESGRPRYPFGVPPAWRALGSSEVRAI